MQKRKQKETSNQLQTPILYIVFNRLNAVKQSFSAIQKAKPSKLYVAADGPRKTKQGEREKCREVREYIKSNITWHCDVYYKFEESNLGCGKGVSSAISWFFEHEEQGIILEDDVVPNQSFFHFCTKLLELHKNDEKVMAITGRNVAGSWNTKSEDSYFFTSTLNVWGWATWRRAWKKFDYDMSDWKELRKNPKFLEKYPKPFKKKVISAYDNMVAKHLDTWDYQWDYAIRKNDGLTAVPNVNLVSNIGFDSDATHTKVENKQAMSVPVHELNVELTKVTKFGEDLDYFKYFISLNKSTVFHKFKIGLHLLFTDPKALIGLIREKL
jgi:hypothetical protein